MGTMIEALLQPLLRKYLFIRGLPLEPWPSTGAGEKDLLADVLRMILGIGTVTCTWALRMVTYGVILVAFCGSVRGVLRGVIFVAVVGVFCGVFDGVLGRVLRGVRRGGFRILRCGVRSSMESCRKIP